MTSRVSRRLISFSTGLLALGYGVLGLMLLWPLPLHLLKAIPGDGFDGWQNLWNLWWVDRASLGEGQSLWHTAMLDYPRGVSLLYHTLNLPNGLLSLPVQQIGGLLPAYNLTVFLSFALGGLGAYLLALRVLRERSDRARAAAAVAGAVYAFSPFHFAHLLGHMQVFSFQWLPFYVLSLWSLLDGIRTGRPTGSPWLLALISLLIASLTDWYNLVYLGLLTVLWVVWFAWDAKSRRARLRTLAAPATVLAVGAVLLSPLLLPMALQATQADYMVTGEQHIVSLSADLVGLVLPQEMHPLWGEATAAVAGRFTSSTSERMLSFGIVPLLLAAIAWRHGGRKSRPLVWAALAFTTLALGPVLHVGGETVQVGGRPVVLPGLMLYRWVPFLTIARSVSRYTVIAQLAVAVLAALGLRLVIARLGRAWIPATAITAALILFEFVPTPYPLAAPDVPDWYRVEAGEETGAILNLPVNWDRPQYLLYQTVHGRPLTSGYTSRRNPWSPVESYPGLQQLRSLGDDVLPFPDPETFATIAADLGLTHIVLDLYQMPGGVERRFTLELTQRLLGDRPAAHADQRLTVYRIDRPQTVRAYAWLDGAWGSVRMSDGQPERMGCAGCDILAKAGAVSAQFTVSCRDVPDVQIEVKAGETASLLSGNGACPVLTGVSWTER